MKNESRVFSYTADKSAWTATALMFAVVVGFEALGLGLAIGLTDPSPLLKLILFSALVLGVGIPCLSRTLIQSGATERVVGQRVAVRGQRPIASAGRVDAGEVVGGEVLRQRLEHGDHLVWPAIVLGHGHQAVVVRVFVVDRRGVNREHDQEDQEQPAREGGFVVVGYRMIHSN